MLQQAKGTNFASESATGVYAVSYAGDTNIFIKGVGFLDSAQSHTVIMSSASFSNIEVAAPPLSEDDAFNSQTALGTLVYRLPGLADLLGVSQVLINQFSTITFDIKIRATLETGELHTFKCKVATNC